MDNAGSSGTFKEGCQIGILGESDAFIACYNKVHKLACCKAPVLIEGETGTGKESAARCMHYLGSRRDQAFIPINCGAVPETVFENELFGHVQGAYTDAKTTRAGLIAQANHGTVFLDEVDGLPPKAQIALLRFLEDQKYRPLGGGSLAQADVGIISATNANLDRMVTQGSFRQDLWFRLATVRIKVPSLRERRGDVALIAHHYVYALSELYDTPPKTLDSSFLAWLERQDWPGNIRELQNCLHREFLLAEGDTIYPSEASVGRGTCFRLELRACEYDFDELKRAVVRNFEQQFLDQIMRKTKGNISQAARMMHKDRRTVGRLLEKNGIDRMRFQ